MLFLFAGISPVTKGVSIVQTIHRSVTQDRIEDLYRDKASGLYWGINVGTGESHILDDGASFVVGALDYGTDRPDVYGVDTLVLALGMLGGILNDGPMQRFLDDCAAEGITPDLLIKAREVVNRAVSGGRKPADDFDMGGF